MSAEVWPIRSAQLSGPTEIFYIIQIQKLRIFFLTQKKYPPQKKRPFGGRGLEITRPLNLSITQADKLQTDEVFNCFEHRK